MKPWHHTLRFTGPLGDLQQCCPHCGKRPQVTPPALRAVANEGSLCRSTATLEQLAGQWPASRWGTRGRCSPEMVERGDSPPERAPQDFTPLPRTPFLGCFHLILSDHRQLKTESSSLQLGFCWHFHAWLWYQGNAGHRMNRAASFVFQFLESWRTGVSSSSGTLHD